MHINPPAVQYTISVLTANDFSTWSWVNQIPQVLFLHFFHFQCFETVGWAAGRAASLSCEVQAWLSVCSEVQMICIWSSWWQCHPIVSCYSKIQNGLPFWCWLTQIVLEKRPLNGCVVVVVVPEENIRHSTVKALKEMQNTDYYQHKKHPLNSPFFIYHQTPDWRKGYWFFYTEVVYRDKHNCPRRDSSLYHTLALNGL